MKQIKIFGLPFISVLEKRELNPENPSTPIGEWLQQVTDGDAAVNVKTSMQFSAVYACVRIISETIASLPIAVLTASDGKIENVSHPLKYLVEKSPNSVMTRFKFWETIISHMLLTGNGYAIIKKNKATQLPEKLLLITNPEEVDILFDPLKDFLGYKYKGKVYPNDEILHIAGLSLDGIKGLSPIEYHRKTISTGLNEVNFQQKFFENGAHLSGIVSFAGSLNEDAYKRIKKSWNERYSGTNNTGATAILEGGADYKPIGIKPVDAQFMEQRRFTIEDIARIYRVPLHLLQDLSRSTNNNIEHQSIDFVMHTIRPTVKRIESELDTKLFTEEEKRAGSVFTRFNLDALLRGDVKSRAEFYKSLYYTASLNSNEIRQMEGLNPYIGGDTYFVQSNTQPVNNISDGTTA